MAVSTREDSESEDEEEDPDDSETLVSLSEQDKGSAVSRWHFMGRELALPATCSMLPCQLES